MLWLYRARRGLPTPGFPKQQRRPGKQQVEKRIPTKPPQFRRGPGSNLRISSNQYQQRDRHDQGLSDRSGE